MKYLVLVSHGGLAAGVQSSLKMFAGDKTDQVIAVGLQEGKSVDDFAVDFTQALDGLSTDDSVLVLADIVGGSPLTTAASVLADIGKLDSAVILGGLNVVFIFFSCITYDFKFLQSSCSLGKDSLSQIFPV